ncbi:MAG: glycosyltransferase family 4 protein [bacterium]|nr:glycosyltransferase family 4 protein [bacterium]
MKLLILTQKIDKNDDVLGFMHEWLQEFAKHFEKVIVIALRVGYYDLPENIKVLSLGKPAQGWSASGGEKITGKLRALFNFYKYIWRERKNYDAVFVHMNPEYIVLGGLFWRLWNKKVSLWYAHGTINPFLKIAEKISHIIFTSTKEGCRISSSKIKIIGQGIDAEFFKPVEREKRSEFKIISVGRISPAKDYETLIKAIQFIIDETDERPQIDIAGDIAVPEDKAYLEKLKSIVSGQKMDKIIEFRGSIPHAEIVGFLQSADLFVNMSHTGSLDKAVLEAMSCGLLILTCNEAFENALGEYRDILMYPKNNFYELAKKIEAVMKMNINERRRISHDLRMIVVNNHSLRHFVEQILNYLNC